MGDDRLMLDARHPIVDHLAPAHDGPQVQIPAPVSTEALSWAENMP